MKTTKVKKVLIALDYNPTAKKVAEEGYALAESMKAEVVLLHVVAEIDYYSTLEYSPIMGFEGYMDMSPFTGNSLERLKIASEQYLEKSRIHLGDKNIEIHVSEGEVAESILKAAKKFHAGIIVMGSHSKKWLENIVMGSETEKVLHQTSVPMFIIPTKKV